VMAAQVIAWAQAPGKIILFGEHAVVYGRPAIAAPLQQVQARAEIFPDETCVVEAVDLGREVLVAQAAADDPLAQVVRLTCAALHQPLPSWRIRVTSQIPMAAGMGSGAAVSTAILRALARAFGKKMTAAEVSAVVYEVEKIYHGSPSGIDNTVIAYEQPVWFVRGQEPEPFVVGKRIHFLVADSGVPSPTREVVEDVNRAWKQDESRYETLFDAAGEIAYQARAAIEQGDVATLGMLMDVNQQVLAEMGVSSPLVERLVRAARNAGALGAKLSGAGRGGNVIALVQPVYAGQIAEAMRKAGAVSVIPTTISPEGR